MFTQNTAIFSDDRLYRYVLFRVFDLGKPSVMFIGLNPSTANETKNDNTITKLVKISQYNGFGSFYMTNLFAIVSTDPKILKTHNNPIGDNDEWLDKVSKECDKVVFAWGNFKEAIERSNPVTQLFKDSWCLKQNKNGSPKHPLYCRDDSILIPYVKSK